MKLQGKESETVSVWRTEQDNDAKDGENRRCRSSGKERRPLMAKYETIVNGDFDSFLKEMEEHIIRSGVTAKLEESSDFEEAGARCSVRVFERYSWLGGNRLSLSVTLFQAGDGPICVSAASTGGSQARFVKINTWGEDNFLAEFENFVRDYEPEEEWPEEVWTGEQ